MASKEKNYESDKTVCIEVRVCMLEEINKALEKQIPKKIKKQQWIDTKCECGYCFSKSYDDGYYSIPYENKTKFCPNCGQAIDWNEGE